MKERLARLFRLFPRWSLITFIALLALSAAVIAAPALTSSAQIASAPTGYDPLSDAEISEATGALVLAQGASAAEVRTSPLLAADGSAITAPAEATILVERHQEEKGVMAAGNWERRADLYIYRYADDTLLHYLYNYEDDSLTLLQQGQDYQPALSMDERDLVTQIAFADPALLAQMQEEYRIITGEELTQPSQISIRPFVYYSGASPATEPPQAQVCGRQRCAQLLIVTGDYTTFQALPVINLSTLSVASIFPLALDPHGPHALPVDDHAHNDTSDNSHAHEDDHDHGEGEQ